MGKSYATDVTPFAAGRRLSNLNDWSKTMQVVHLYRLEVNFGSHTKIYKIAYKTRTKTKGRTKWEEILISAQAAGGWGRCKPANRVQGRSTG